MDTVEELAPLLRSWDENGDRLSKRPSNLFNGMIAPMTQFDIRGAIWYQGEANNGGGHQYANLFPTLIKTGEPRLESMICPSTLSNWRRIATRTSRARSLAEVWDAQLKTLKSVPNTGMVVTTDIGDVENIHPTNKQAVGRRLAVIALANVYQDQLPTGKQDLVYSGPIYESMSTNQNRIRLTFEHAVRVSAKDSRTRTRTIS